MLALLAFATSTQAQQRPGITLFQEDAAARAAAQTSPLAAQLRQSRPFTLDPAATRTALAAAPRESQPGGPPVVLALPLPDGRTARFALRETAVMAPALAARYPAIRTYSGAGLDDATATIRLDLTPAGLHAQILSATSGAVYLDPISPTDPAHYLSYFVADQLVPASVGCVAPAGPVTTAAPTAPGAAKTPTGLAPPTAARGSGQQLHMYRLAVATTDEYTAARGGTVASALASVVTTVNRITGFYERELAIRLELVATNDQIISPNSSTAPDPYSNNNYYPTALPEVQTRIDAVVGSGNYDIGHLFGTIGGGYSFIGVLCGNSKAMGETGLFNPSGDAFDIQLVAHEMGHQFGATHTFNADNAGSCSVANREGTTAYEPGSGSTMMAYPGICGGENIQGGRDGYFHTVSYAQIQNVVNSRACGTALPTGNNAPVVSTQASLKLLPISTPFRLTAAATDPDNDALTYCWEQLDRGPAASLGTPQVVGSVVPLFRSWLPGSSPTRYFPQLSTLLANGSSNAERLPTVTRPLSFRCTVRDYHSGSAGVVGGSDFSTTLVLSTTSTAGPFVVTAPNTAVSWAAGSTQTVTWNVAGTDANGVDCATVNIRLSADGGLTYPTVVLANTPNDGSQTITIPNVPGSATRLMVEAANNFFFDISNQNFTITPQPGAPSISSLSPSHGPVGTVVTITGSNLTGTTAVSFDGVSASFANVTATSLTATVPNVAAGTASGAVTTASGTSNGLPFTVQPVVAGLSPGSGYPATSQQVGTTVVISGSGLGNAILVYFAGDVTTDFTVNATGTEITVTVPQFATTAPVRVVTANGTATSPGDFTVLPVPCTPPRNLSVTNITSTSAEVNFTPSLADPDSYMLTTVPATSQPNAQNGGLISGLSPNTIYTVSMVSDCGNGNTSAAATVQFATPPAGFTNNECAGAINLIVAAPGGACAPTGGYMTGATQSLPPALCSGTSYLSARDVWYRFVATGPVHTVTVSSSFNGVLEAFTGSCGSLNSLECVDVSLSGGENLTLLSLVPGTTYYVRYYSRTTAIGSYIAACVTTPAPAAGACAAPTGLAVSGLTSTTATLSFVPTGGAVSYTVSTIPRSTTRTVAGGPVAFTNLQSGTRYVASVTSTCADGSVSAPNQLAFTTDLPDLVVSNYRSIAARAYRNITVTATGSASLSAPGSTGTSVWVAGTFLVQRGGTFNDNCQVLNGPGNFVLEPNTYANICHGEGVSQSGPTGAVQVTGGRLFSNNTEFYYQPADNHTPCVTGTGLPDTVKVLYISAYPGSDYTLSRSVAVRQEMQLAGVNFYLGSSNLLLLSNIHRTAWLYDYEGRVLNNGTGRATMQRYVSPTTSYAGPGYRHYSAPVHGAQISGLAVPGQFTPLVNSAYNALPTPSLSAGQFPTVFRYTESRLTAAYPGFDAGWESPGSLAEPLESGRGYTVNIAPSATVALTGEFNSGPINTGPLSGGGGPNAGWHLLGNPYPSPIVFSSYVNDSLPLGLAHAVYVFEPNSQYGGFYRAFVNGIGTDGQTYLSLPAMQGFFMRATQNVPAGFTFTDDLRSYGGEDSAAFHRQAGPGSTRPARPTLRLTLAGSTVAQGLDHTVIYLENGATALGTDGKYDAVKLPGPGALLQLASQMPGSGNEALAINGLPDLTATAPTRVPLTLSVTAPGAFQLRVAALDNFDPAVPVLLLDHARGTTTDLRRQPTYAFQASQTGALNGRFEVLLGRVGTATATATAASSQFSLWPNPVLHGAALRLTLDSPAAAATVTLYNVLGQVIIQQDFSGRTVELATTGLAPGTYLVSVQASERAAVTRRVVLE
jgi:hypothetical protein